MKTRIFLIVLLLTSFCVSVGGESSFSLYLSPGVNIPMGLSSQAFSLGGSVKLSCGYGFSELHFLSLHGFVDYSFNPVISAEILSKISAAAGIGVNFLILPWLSLKASFSGGGYVAVLPTESIPHVGSCFLIAGNVGLFFELTPIVSIGLEGIYLNYIDIYSGIGVSVVTGINIRGGKSQIIQQEEPLKPEPLAQENEFSEQKGKGVDFLEVEFENVFPVLFKYYDENSIGRATLKNFEGVAVENVGVSFYVKQYMDNPKMTQVIERLEPGEEKEIEIYGLFSNRVLEITEGTKVSALVSINYIKNNEEVTKEDIQTIRLQNRNAITWDDDRKASAFVTAKDPAVLKFSKNIVVWIKGPEFRAVNKNLLSAVGLHEALDLFGISYVIDPTTPYVELSQNKPAIDYLQFPKQTLEFLAGDCDDLSILYASLLEAVGIETAFVTTPGHIFVAFSLDLEPDEARKTFLYPDDLIFREGRSWLPVEITMRNDGFVKAWTAGAKEWRENVSKGKAGFFPMHKSWEVYEPVGFSGIPTLVMPAREKVISRYVAEVGKFIKREIYPQESRLLREIEHRPEDLSLANRLGILYARYGLDDKARSEFDKVLEKKDYLPTLVNMGNLYYLNGEMKKAQEYYKRAQAISPNNAKVLLSVARVDHELENYGMAREAYNKLKEVDPSLAERFAYLGLRGEEASRAADVGEIKGIVIWAEE